MVERQRADVTSDFRIASPAADGLNEVQLHGSEETRMF